MAGAAANRARYSRNSAIRARNIEDPACAHQVDVLADKGILVRTVDRHQHLVERNARRQPVTRDLAERVALDYLVNARFIGE
jgi:hypothetical protein